LRDFPRDELPLMSPKVLRGTEIVPARPFDAVASASSGPIRAQALRMAVALTETEGAMPQNV
jgi:hypothetical protein